MAAHMFNVVPPTVVLLFPCKTHPKMSHLERAQLALSRQMQEEMQPLLEELPQYLARHPSNAKWFSSVAGAGLAALGQTSLVVKEVLTFWPALLGERNLT